MSTRDIEKSAPKIGRAARKAAPRTSLVQLQQVFRSRLQANAPWLWGGAPPHAELRAAQLQQLTSALRAEEKHPTDAAYLTALLHEAVDGYNAHHQGDEVEVPKSLIAIIPDRADWGLAHIEGLKTARQLRERYEAAVKGFVWEAAPARLWALCVASAIFDSLCLNQRSLRLFGAFLRSSRNKIHMAADLPPWVDLKDRGTGQGLRYSSGVDAQGPYALQRLFLAPRTAALVALCWKHGRMRPLPASLRDSTSYALRFGLGLDPSERLKLSQILRGVAPQWAKPPYPLLGHGGLPPLRGTRGGVDARLRL